MKSKTDLTFEKIGLRVRPVGIITDEAFTKDEFNIILETLQRIGIPSKKNELYQSVHLFHKKGVYKLVHFKELFMLDGKDSTITEEDYARRNTVAKLLEEWELLDIDGEDKKKHDTDNAKSFCQVISAKDKANWKLISKYSIGA